ncbi:neural cell adhesion molecule 2-like [Tachysurus fulvidraco]|uniref:neural cell adhesion molecule 2-like n=1 Tax=Tachysurus fulvidraco TaxID=1234273 RepID=UPI001FED47A3|nr:neural cell adhesion molecule 2-like [Tachysurus fulvidraco]
MAQAYITVQVLLLLATAIPISCSYSMRASEVFVTRGSVAVLPCVMSSSSQHPTAVIWKRIIEGEERTVWRRDRSGLEFRAVGQAPQAHCPHPNFGNSDFSLHIQGTTEDDSGMYRCEVEGQNIKNVMLHVVKVSFTPAEVFEGDRLTLTCSITPQPLAKTTKWELNGSPIASRSGIQTYTIDKVSQKDAGTWSCLIRNKQTEANASTSLQVKGILVPKDNSEVVYAQLGSSVTLPCIFSSELLFNSSSWNRVSKTSNLPAVLPSSFNISSNPRVSPCSSMRLVKSAYIESVQDGDEGTYRCSGEVEGGNGKRVEVERSIQLITAQVLSSNKNGKMTLTCRISSTSQVTDYEWIHVEYSVNDTQIFTSVQKSTSKVLSVQKEKQFGEWVCRFYNKQQLLGNATYQPHIMSGLEGKQQSTSTNKVVLIIGMCFLVLLLVLILLQLYKNHRRRKMIFQYPAMETIVHLAANEREFRGRVKEREKTQIGACGENPKSDLV